VPLRIVHQLSLLLSFAVLLAVTTISIAVAWNLRSGFSDYLQIRDQAELDRLAQRVSVSYANDPALNRLRGSPEAMRNVIESASPSDATRETHDPLSNILRRTYIVDLQGRSIAGHPISNAEPLLQSPIRIGGKIVAYAQLPRAPNLESVDADFLQRQYWRLGTVVCITTIAAFICARWVARRWSRPLHALRLATERFASGDFNVTLLDRQPQSHTQEIAQLTDAIRRMAESLQTLEGARRQWLAQISHELRTPLTVLRGELEAIHEGARKPTPRNTYHPAR
jgi:two-component system, OmpR family, sensor histidine kinase BaeS